MRQRSLWIVGLLIVAAGAFLRFHALDRQSLWDDEMTTLQITSMSFPQELERHKTYEVHPPLFFLQFRAWRHIFGDRLSILRANSALWGTLSLVAIYALASSLSMSVWASLLGMAVLAFSPFHLAYSQEIRPYSLAIFLAIFGFWVVEKLVRSPRKRWPWGVFFIILTSELYTHYWGAFVGTAQTLYGFYRFKQRPERWVWAAVCFASAAAFLVWIPILWEQIKILKGLTGFWSYSPSLLNLVRTFLAFSGTCFRFASSDFVMDGPRVLRFGVLAVYGLGFFMGFRKAPTAMRFWLIVGLGLPFTLSYWKQGLYLWYRYTSLIYPAFILWVVAGLTSLSFSWPRRLSLSVILLAGLWGCHAYFSGWEKANPKAVVTYVNQQVTPNTIVVRPSYFSDLFSFYYAQTAPVLDQHEQDSAEKRAHLKSRNILLVAFDVPSDPITDAFKREFKVIDARHFPGFARLGITVYSLRSKWYD